MNFSSAFGVMFGIFVMYSALRASADDMRFFLDFHGILIVCGGTAAAARAVDRDGDVVGDFKKRDNALALNAGCFNN